MGWELNQGPSTLEASALLWTVPQPPLLPLFLNLAIGDQLDSADRWNQFSDRRNLISAVIRGRGGGGKGAAVAIVKCCGQVQSARKTGRWEAVEEVWVRIVTEVKLKGRSENRLYWPRQPKMKSLLMCVCGGGVQCWSITLYVYMSIYVCRYFWGGDLLNWFISDVEYLRWYITRIEDSSRIFEICFWR